MCLCPALLAHRCGRHPPRHLCCAQVHVLEHAWPILPAADTSRQQQPPEERGLLHVAQRHPRTAALLLSTPGFLDADVVGRLLRKASALLLLLLVWLRRHCAGSVASMQRVHAGMGHTGATACLQTSLYWKSMTSCAGLCLLRLQPAQLPVRAPTTNLGNTAARPFHRPFIQSCHRTVTAQRLQTATTDMHSLVCSAALLSPLVVISSPSSRAQLEMSCGYWLP